MNKRNAIIRILLEIIIIIGSIVASALNYNADNTFIGVCWNIVSVMWAIDLGNNINDLIRNDYICFLEFMTYQYMEKIKTEKKEQNAKQEQTNSSKEFKSK